MKINKNDLLTILKVIEHSIKKNVPDYIEMENDYYWDIPEEIIYNPEIDPKELVMGQISEDWDELQRLLSNEDDAISYDLKRLAVILQAIRSQGPSIW